MMKKYFMKVVALAVLMLGIDVAFGNLMDTILMRKGGKVSYIEGEINEDILVMGSSRAYRSYVPTIMMDTLGKSVYNCGVECQGIISNYIRWKVISQQYHPKLIIYDLMPCFDIWAGTDVIENQLLSVKYYYHKEGVSEVFADLERTSLERTNKFKMSFSLYRYNTDFLTIIQEYRKGSADICGYQPLKRTMDKRIVSDSGKKKEGTMMAVDSIKLRYWDKFLREAKEYGTKVVFSVSPAYNGCIHGCIIRDVDLPPIQTLCEKYDIPFLSMEKDTGFVYHEEFFADGAHLNGKGAEAFTKDFCSRYKEVLLSSME